MKTRKLKSFLFIMILIMLALIPISVNAQSRLVVRVAYHSVTNYQNGTYNTRKSGWGYDYLQELAKYANFEYEYVECDNFNDSLNKLINGEVDLMGNLSMTDERKEHIYYSTNPQGVEEYYIYTLSSNDKITVEPTTLNNLKCSVNKNSIQEKLFLDYCNKHNITINENDFVYYTNGNDKIKTLVDGLSDFTVSTKITNQDIKNNNLKQLQSIGESYYYFGVSKKSSNSALIIDKVNYAQSKILSINPNFNEILKNSYIQEENIINTNLDDEEKQYISNYLSNNKSIKVGILNTELPLSTFETYVAKGVIVDALDLISKTYNFKVTYSAYESEELLINALNSGEVDIIAPYNFDLNESEERNILRTNSIIDENIRLYYGCLYEDLQFNTAAIEKGNVSLIKYYKQLNSDVVIKEYNSQIDCIKAVLKGEADFSLSYDSSYGYYTEIYQKEIEGIKTILIDEKSAVCLGVSQDDIILLAILNRGIGLCNRGFITESLIRNSQYELSYTFEDIVKNNAPLALQILLGTFLIFLAIVLYFHIRQRKYVTILRKDELTKNPTGNYFYMTMRKMLNKYSQEDFDFLVTDIIDFKTYNDQYGTLDGDKLLLEVSKFCESKIKDKCVFGRIGNDQFGLLAPHSLDVYNYTKTHFSHEFVSNFAIKKNLKAFEIKFGVYENVDRSLSCQQMRDRAFIALEEIKETHSVYIHKYDEVLRERKVWVQWIAQNMNEAIKNKEFEVWYQPKHRLSDDVFVGCEALVRWRSLEKGLISPGLFIPLFEKNSFICELDKYVSERVVQDIDRWRKMGFSDFPVSINLSRVDLEKNDVVSYLLPLVNKYNIAPSHIHIEITETAYDNSQDVIVSKLDSLHQAGFVIEMDDFGTGYSNLNMFSEMNVDVIKLDMKFIQQSESKQNDKLMKYIIDMIKALDLKVIAEGVETVSQIEKLKSLGCDMVQGYYYSRPLPMDEFITYLNKHNLKK